MIDTVSPIIILAGPTGVGKTSLSLEIAEKYSAEIVGVDSMQVYRYMDIGTAKPTPAERARAPHHLIDFIDPADHYTAGRYVVDAWAAIREIRGRGRIPFLVGGTGMYLQSLLSGLFSHQPGSLSGDNEKSRLAWRESLKKRLAKEGREPLYQELRKYDPVSAARIHPNDSQRLLRALEIFFSTGIPWSEHLARQQAMKGKAKTGHLLKLGLFREREQLYQRINMRVELMVAAGLKDEVQGLLDMGYHGGLKPMQSIGYLHMVRYLAGHRTWDETIRQLARDTRQYAKRQYTWFKRDPEINWFSPQKTKEIFTRINAFLGKRRI
ncbi:MAG: tRNA (adenosine(37)-N6)-dimethylallyltransferase MiaA [Desulfobacterales bacterium]|nr:tRNA (adenosine(37)-N6)-dimethylallyltransferase MiaA [Desulfobacterales bacterium]